MTLRAKVRLIEITTRAYSTAKQLKFVAVYDMSIPEDRRFQEAAPWAEFTTLVDNPEAHAQFELGKSYYIDFTPTDQAAVLATAP